MITLAESQKTFFQLLVSVQNSREALDAVQAGVDLIDLKNPNLGSLGMTQVSVMQEVIQQLKSCKPGLDSLSLSAALGELFEWSPREQIPCIPAEISFLKVGLSGLYNIPNWSKFWYQLREQIEEQAQKKFYWIAVVYADWRACAAPSPEEVLGVTLESCQGVLFDTFFKKEKTLLDYFTIDQLAKYTQKIQQQGALVALAGGLKQETLPALKPLHPQIVAVRSAVCQNENRKSEINSQAVKLFSQELLNLQQSLILEPQSH